ncbi:rab-GTPase-TBC domain-containing protein [Xylariales sp. PMI_506]|nr:rab-GTPase-TBC domain-containing protein [Xylariales sp. PMI_506]
MKAQKYPARRPPRRPSALVPFKDDSGLVAFRYDHAVQLEPPIPIPPPRSPLRQRPTPSSRRPVSVASAPSPAPVVIAPPRGPAPPREQHPAFRTTPQTDPRESKRDSGLAPTTSSRAGTLYESEGEDPFQYDKTTNPQQPWIKKANPDLLIPPLRLKPSNSSVQQTSNEHHQQQQKQQHERQRQQHQSQSQSPSRRQPPSVPPPPPPPQAYLTSCINNSGDQSVPPHSPSLTDAETLSPDSLDTPPANFLDKFPVPSAFIPRALNNFRTSGSMKSKRLRKKSVPQVLSEVEDPPTPAVPIREVQQPPVQRTTIAHPVTATAHANNISTSARSGVPLARTPSAAPPRNMGTPAHHNARTPGMESPRLEGNTNTSGGDDFLDFLNNVSFSKRGSIILGGHRPSGHNVSMSVNSIPSRARGSELSTQPEECQPRAFPLSPMKPQDEQSAAPPIAFDNGAGAATASRRPARLKAPSELRPASAVEPPATPRSPKRPPTARVLTTDVERESQKVRSLYEPGEGLRWEEGAAPFFAGDRLEPTAEVPSEADEHDAANLHPNQDVVSGGRTARSNGTTTSVVPTASLHDEPKRQAHELAGGIEDWEDVHGEDVDRYGFISPRRPVTPSNPSSEPSSPARSSPRKHRNGLMRREHSGYLQAKRGPTKKMSARSLHTQASEMSTTSRVSTRSALRQAANLLPHNRERRWMDEAGVMLAQQPGLTNIGEDVSAGRLAEEYKHKEWERVEKWRKMAKVVKQGKDGEGMVFEFDVKSPKLIERTWKGIPDRWRSAAWYSFLATSARNSPTPSATEEELITQFRLLQEEPCLDDVQIDLDVPRTISQHIMFRRRYRGGQRLLFRVLHAVSLYFPETGYVQGMASLAATLLSYYDEESCFVMLVRLWELRGLKWLYRPQFAELIAALNDFERVWLADKAVAKYLKDLCIDPTAYGTRWYLTLFNLSIPFSSQLRVWDIFMLLGGSPPAPVNSNPIEPGKGPASLVSSKGLEVLHASSTSLLLALSEHIVGSDFENAMKALTSFVPIKNDELFMKIVRAEYKHQQSKMRKA